MSADDELNDRFMEALRNPGVAFELDRDILRGRALVRVTVPGPTPRSKRKQPIPVIIGDEGQTHADLLHGLANTLAEAVSR